jgi:hypothetical protein
MEQREPDLWKEVRAVHQFVDNKDGWVLGSAIKDAVYPQSDSKEEYLVKAHELEIVGLLEQGTISTNLYTDENMWRSTGKRVGDVSIDDVTGPRKDSNG